MTAVTPHRTRPVRRVGGLRLVGMVAMVAVTGCTGGGAIPPASSTAAPPSTTSSTSSATTTSTPAPPSTSTTPPTTPTADPVIAKIPAAARIESEAGAAAFMNFYFKQLNLAFRQAESSHMAGLATSACVTCQAFNEGILGLKKANRRYSDDLVRVTRATALNFTDNARQILIDVEQREVKVIDASGGSVGTTPAGRASFVASLKFNSARWFVVRLQKANS